MTVALSTTGSRRIEENGGGSGDKLRRMGRRGIARSSTARLIARLALLSAIPIATACSLLVTTDADQCSTTADCIAKGGAFADSVCTTNHVCIANACTSNAQCAASARPGEHWICRHADFKCAPLESQDCQTLLADPEDITNDATIWLGTLLPVTGDNASEGLPNQNGVEVARREFKTTVNGLPPAKPDGPRQPIAFVACTDADDPDRAAHHLVDDVKVPAIIGPAFSGVLIKVATDVTIKGGTLIISPSATSPFITTIQKDPPRLVWRTCPSDTEQSIAMSQLLATKIETDLHAPAGPLKTGDQLRLAVVHKGDAYGTGLAGALFDVVKFNGKTAAENQGANNYKAFDYGDPKAADAETKYAKAVDDLNAYAPHVIVAIGTVEVVTKVYAPLEGKWSTAAYKPRWLLADGAEIPEVVTAIDGNVDLRHRTLGTVPGVAPTATLYQLFSSRYQSMISDGTKPDQYTASAYDAAYLLAYAAAAAQDQPLTGAVFAKELARMVPPGKLEAGRQEQINDALDELLAGRNIDYDGASGPLDFDVTIGEAPADIQVWCVAPDGAGSKLSLSGMFYSAKTQKLEGAIQNCP